MIVRISQYSIRLLFIVLIFVGVSRISVYSQKSLSGNLNQPSQHVVSLTAGSAIVTDVTKFAPGDTVLLIQMQGVKIVAPNSPAYGGIQDTLRGPGQHEFLIIQDTLPTNEMIFRNNIIKAFDVRGNVQVVRVPYFNSAVVTNKLFCTPWDSTAKHGGVLALVIGRRLMLNADIDVSNLGFRGGKDTIGDGRPINDAPITDGYFYSKSFTNAGYKGEGIAIHEDNNALLTPGHTKGQGPNRTGGGGGNGRFSGGGGGALIGEGGQGGNEKFLDVAPFPGGRGGLSSDDARIPDRIFLGGGGGASTSLTGLSPAAGNGGGIVIIVTDTITGNGGNIISNGGNGGTAVVDGGAGGGGGGGTIALSLNSYGSAALGLSVAGGNGGDNPGGFGEGGGGGGGLLFVSTNTTLNVDPILNGGNGGNGLVTSAGGDGENRLGFKANLNGFLFNSIRSSVTGNQEDSICSNMVPHRITGTIPVGGTPPYTYLWEYSHDNVTWFPLANDPDPTHYTPSATEATTIWYRRTITDSSLPTALVDVSKTVRIKVQPFIKNNVVGNSDTICFAQNPSTFSSKAVLLDGNGIYSFTWKVSLNGTSFSVPPNSHNAEDYTPLPALTLTSWYRRTVNSGRCIDSSAIVKITVLDSLQKNRILNAPPDICFGSTFNNLTGSTTLTVPALAGGDNVYKYKWESNINGSGWGTAPGVSNGPNYDPGELAQRVPFNEYYFRRIVYSGSNDVCVTTSNTVHFKDFPVLTNNTIAAAQTICESKIPIKLTGTVSPALTGGDGTYTYKWDYSPDNTNWFDAVTPAADYQPPALGANAWYRRTVNSSACSSVSVPVMITVQPAIKNNTISLKSGLTDSTICSGAAPKGLIGLKPPVLSGGDGSTYTYKWKFSNDNISWVDTSVVTSMFNPGLLNTTRWYRRVVSSGTCKDSANSVRIDVLPPVINTIPVAKDVCVNSPSSPVVGLTLSGGKTGQYKFLWESSPTGSAPWTNVTADTIRTASGADLQLPPLSNPIFYRRNVWSGPYNTCFSVSNNVSVLITPKPFPVYAGKDTILNSFEFLYKLNASQLQLGTGTWEVTASQGSPVFDDATSFNTTVRNLSPGLNSLTWKVINGVCEVDTSVDITIVNLDVPQGISPNSDGKNDELIINGLDFSLDNQGRPNQSIQLTILNSAGAQVYFTTNDNGGEWRPWDGTTSDGDQLPEGTYYYLLRITSNRTLSSAVLKKSGFIILKRYK